MVTPVGPAHVGCRRDIGKADGPLFRLLQDMDARSLLTRTILDWTYNPSRRIR